MESEGEQLRMYLKANKLNQEAFAEKLGLTRQGLGYHFRKDKLDYEFKELLAKNDVKIFFPKDNSKYNEASPIDLGDVVIMNVPLVSQYAWASYTRGYADAEYIGTLPKVPFMVDKEYKGDYMAFEVKGDSMDNGTRKGYMQGEILLCREVPQHHWQNKLHIKKWDFVIATKEDGILVKQITKHDPATGAITLHSLNPDYEDIEMNLSQVSKIFNVVQVSYKKLKG